MEHRSCSLISVLCSLFSDLSGRPDSSRKGAKAQRWQAPLFHLLCALGASVALPGCERTISERAVNPAFGGLQGARTQVQRKERESFAIGADAPDDIVVEHEDGTVTLISRRAAHLMSHIQRTLARDEEELFVDQVLSERTKQEYRERGLDPAEAFHALKDRSADISKLFSRMPFGEASPSVIMSKVDDKTLRLTLTGAGTRDLQWTTMDMVLEGGNYRLRWFGRGGR
jgi:hypothetical protein